jgi:hypothetical protein
MTSSMIFDHSEAIQHAPGCAEVAEGPVLGTRGIARQALQAGQYFLGTAQILL